MFTFGSLDCTRKPYILPCREKFALRESTVAPKFDYLDIPHLNRSRGHYSEWIVKKKYATVLRLIQTAASIGANENLPLHFSYQRTPRLNLALSEPPSSVERIHCCIIYTNGNFTYTTRQGSYLAQTGFAAFSRGQCVPLC